MRERPDAGGPKDHARADAGVARAPADRCPRPCRRAGARLLPRVHRARDRLGVRELEGYKATLRAQQVPRDSIEGWLAAVREARGELEGDSEEPPDLPPTID